MSFVANSKLLSTLETSVEFTTSSVNILPDSNTLVPLASVVVSKSVVCLILNGKTFVAGKSLTI